MALHMKVDPHVPEDRSLVLAAEVIQAGGVVVYPTETVYGLGANAWNRDAVKRIQAIKRRPENKPVLVIVHSDESVRRLTVAISGAAEALMSAFWPGPLTLVFRAARDVPEELTLGTGTIGIRIPSLPLCLRLAELCGLPITSTSANAAGAPVPPTVAEIESALAPGVDLFLDAGVLPARPPSTVVDVSGPIPRLLRQGAVPKERIAMIVPELLE